MMRTLLVATALLARPLANPDVLEPSVQNEVDHALSLVPVRPAETNQAVLAVQRAFIRLYATNGMDATERAIALVSSQRNGEWTWRGTNVTAAAVRLLGGGAGPVPEREGKGGENAGTDRKDP